MNRKWSAVIILSVAVMLQGCGHIAEGKDSMTENKLATQKHCFGRYEVELPDYMYMYSGNYNFDNFYLDMVTAIRSGNPTLEKDWEKYIKDTIAPDMRKDSIGYGSKIVHQDMKSNPRVIVEYVNTTNGNSSLARLYMFSSFYLKHFPERNEWLLLNGGSIELPRPLPDDQLRQQVQRKLDAQMDDINKITYKPYPHFAPGFCLDNEYHYYPGRLEKNESYSIYWHSKREGSKTFLSVEVKTYLKGEEADMESRVSKGKLLQLFFPSTTVEVGGMKGELYTSRDKSNPSAREFQWIPSHVETGNHMKPLIKIAGRFDTRDLPPELRDKVSGEELAMWVLESIKMRKGADEDIQMYGH
ncbi:hypothetical protein NX790_17580 [Enterobacter asburiae]|uniref:hypothetical protein n=1 Tax=Enterobacter TaxID=547 RepID=UPI000EAF989F|nr:hypothetical protein [Enterobacter asburiae]MCM7774149.1 hypothetical protein [Enterobacter asburiae]MCS5456221.1 hypothetical protein [Enterobacter asburiae]HDV9838836.1 hypothetical protein [Enterobacter asburiae]